MTVDQSIDKPVTADDFESVSAKIAECQKKMEEVAASYGFTVWEITPYRQSELLAQTCEKANLRLTVTRHLKARAGTHPWEILLDGDRTTAETLEDAARVARRTYRERKDLEDWRKDSDKRRRLAEAAVSRPWEG